MRLQGNIGLGYSVRNYCKTVFRGVILVVCFCPRTRLGSSWLLNVCFEVWQHSVCDALSGICAAAYEPWMDAEEFSLEDFDCTVTLLPAAVATEPPLELKRERDEFQPG